MTSCSFEDQSVNGEIINRMKSCFDEAKKILLERSTLNNIHPFEITQIAVALFQAGYGQNL